MALEAEAVVESAPAAELESKGKGKTGPPKGKGKAIQIAVEATAVDRNEVEAASGVEVQPVVEAESVAALVAPTAKHVSLPLRTELGGVATAPGASEGQVCLMFPGQVFPTREVKLLDSVKDIPAVKEMIDKAAAILGYNLLEKCLNGKELEQTRHCQPAMFVAGLAAVEKLKMERPGCLERLQGCAGLSLGEYTALCVAGVFSFEAGLKLLKLRGEIMQEEAMARPQCMLSVFGPSQDDLSQLCEQAKSGPDDVCEIVNILFPMGFFCAGDTHCMENLSEKLLSLATTPMVSPKTTSVAFHTSLMAGARKKLEVELKKLQQEMKPPRCNVYMNATGEKITRDTPASEIIKLMSEQMTSTVQWEECVRQLVRDGGTEFYECCQKNSLKRMMWRIDKEASAKCTTVEAFFQP